MRKSRVLIVEDDPDGRQSVTEAIEELGFEVVAVASGREGEKAFCDGYFDLVLSDLVLPDIDGIELMRVIKVRDDKVPFLIMTAYGTVSTAVQALKAGAYDYITKPLDLDDLQLKVTRAAEAGSLRGEVERLRESIHNRYSTASIVSQNPDMLELLDQVRILADTDVTVLIQGESGVGKELIARALHVEGRRSVGPFIAVNCGAFAESLLESELFGHEKGSFTGASNLRKGAFERADGGTLFLDEIGNAPVSVQVKLLRVLEERNFMRVGGHDVIDVDVRVISASNKDLSLMAAEGDFRQDLLYRLKVVTLEIPPLRKRSEDIRPLVDFFVTAACREHGREITGIEQGVYDVLQRYNWPGNIRELRNVVESSVIMSKGPVLKCESINIDSIRRDSSSVFSVPENMSMADMEKEILHQMLSRCLGNKTIVAEKLGLSRRTIQRKIKDYALPF